MAKTLDQEALEARRGTDSVQTHFLRLLELGSPSVSEMAYAIKARIKDDFKIVEKVRTKRASRPEYKVSNLRDIVGIRIVTLYRLDALSILPVFLQRVSENSGAEEAHLFLENPLEEIKIYSVSPNSDAQNLATRIEGIFRDHGFADKCRIEQKAESYTSIHMVLWTRAKWNKKYVEIPVEVQLRTALEDVWAEMEHQLKYKRSMKIDDADAVAMMENCLAHLNVMKTLNDGLAQYGDQVKIQIDQLTNSLRRHSRVRLAEEPETRLNKFKAYEGAIKSEVRELLGESREAFAVEVSQFEKSTRKVNDLKRVSRDLEKFLEALPDRGLDDEFQAELSYVANMENALVQYEIGNRLGAGVSGNAHLVKSQGIYSSMEERFPERGIIQYRLARVLSRLGDKVLAKDKMAALLSSYENFDLPDDHWVHASAYRILGFWHWDGVEREGSGREDPVKEEFKGSVLDAAVCSLRASNIPVSDVTLPAEMPHESARVMALSNLVFFVVEYLEAGGTWAELGAAGISKEIFRQAKDEVRQFDTESELDFHKLNTLRRAYLYEGEIAEAKEVATLAIKVLEDAGYRDRGGATVEEHVLRMCIKTVDGA